MDSHFINTVIDFCYELNVDNCYHFSFIWVLITIYFTFPMFFTILSLVVTVEEINILQALSIILQVPLLL